MKRIAFALLLACGLLTCGFAQKTDGMSKSDIVLMKIKQNFLMIQIAPLALNAQQIDDYLDLVEKLNVRLDKLYDAETAALTALEPSIDKSIESAVAKGGYPSKETQTNINKAFRNSSLARVLETSKMVEELLTFSKKKLNEGQLKCMKNSFEPDIISPADKGKNLTDDDKLRYFLGHVFLDPLVHDLLMRMHKAQKA